MANTVQLKRTATPGNIPTTSQIALGEVAINTYDGKVFIKKNNGSDAIIEIGSKTPVIATPSYASTMSVSVAGIDLVRVALTGNVTTFNLTGAVDGQKVIIEFVQDSTGSRTVAFGTSIRFGSDITAATLTTTGLKTDRVGIIYNSAATKYDVIAFVKGF